MMVTSGYGSTNKQTNNGLIMIFTDENGGRKHSNFILYIFDPSNNFSSRHKSKWTYVLL